jgi:hypothetical protein
VPGIANVCMMTYSSSMPTATVTCTAAKSKGRDKSSVYLLL